MKNNSFFPKNPLNKIPALINKHNNPQTDQAGILDSPSAFLKPPSDNNQDLSNQINNFKFHTLLNFLKNKK